MMRFFFHWLRRNVWKFTLQTSVIFLEPYGGIFIKAEAATPKTVAFTPLMKIEKNENRKDIILNAKNIRKTWKTPIMILEKDAKRHWVWTRQITRKSAGISVALMK